MALRCAVIRRASRARTRRDALIVDFGASERCSGSSVAGSIGMPPVSSAMVTSGPC
jgi:hypothetical protein